MIKSRIPKSIGQQELVLTQAAEDKIKKSIQTAQNPKKKYFRIYITGGGCSGFKYEFKLDDRIDSFMDKSFHYESFDLLVDNISFNYIKGSQVNFVQDLTGARFQINNPNIQSSCSCGLSFSLNT